MNKTRFYEITQAAAKGEDLSQFVPTNAAEAALIADLNGGGATVKTSGEGTLLVAETECTKIFPNLNLTEEDVLNIITEYETIETSNYNKFLISNYDSVNDESYMFTYIFDENMGIMIALLKMDSYQTPVQYCYVSKAFADAANQYDPTLGLVPGWQTQNLTEEGCFEFPELKGGNVHYSRTPEGCEVLSKIFSANEPYKSNEKKVSGSLDGSDITVEVSGDQTIDIASLLDENKLPLNINIKVVSGE